MTDLALTVSKKDPKYWETMYDSLANEKTYWKSKSVELQAKVDELTAALKKIAWNLEEAQPIAEEAQHIAEEALKQEAEQVIVRGVSVPSSDFDKQEGE